MTPNKTDALYPAAAPPFRVERQWRRVGDLHLSPATSMNIVFEPHLRRQALLLCFLCLVLSAAGCASYARWSDRSLNEVEQRNEAAKEQERWWWAEGTAVYTR